MLVRLLVGKSTFIEWKKKSTKNISDLIKVIILILDFSKRKLYQLNNKAFRSGIWEVFGGVDCTKILACICFFSPQRKILFVAHTL